MKYREITIHTTSAGIEAVSNLLIALGVGGFEVVDSEDFSEFIDTVTPHWDYVDESLMALQNAESVIRIYLPENAQGLQSLGMIEKGLDELRGSEYADMYGALALSLVEREDSEWTDTWKQYYKPIEISDKLAVVPVWEEFTPAAGQKVLWMDPGAAFGTGSHETTSLCLSVLSEMALQDKSVLDVGCGSGILGIAALLLGAERNVGVDIDELAVKAGGENAERNGVADKCTFLAGDLVDKVSGQYDVICANIVADVIKMLLPQVGAFLAPNGKLILSGIIDTRTDEIKAAAAENGFAMEQCLEKRGWSALVCTRESQ